MTIKTRFAPSPTGYLHLGNVRTALFNALFARRHNGMFLLRIEDTDAERSRAEYQAALQQDLAWLGLDWQEGPQCEGEAGPYRQAERGELYAHYYQRLQDLELAYPCFCSEQALKQVRKAQLAAGQPPRYPGTCARLSAAEVEAKLAAGIAPTLRFRVPKGAVVAFTDLVRGEQHYQTDEIGDFIIRRADGSAAFFFSNAIDDALMGVTHVLRGEDHLTNTPRQQMLLQALGLPVPRYGHIAMIVGPGGDPLSKRAGAASIRELREQGYLPLAVNNHLARLGHTYTETHLLAMPALAEQFDLAHLGRAAARHDPAQLQHWQKLALAELKPSERWEWLMQHAPGVADWVPEDKAPVFLAGVWGNLEQPADAVFWAERLLGRQPIRSDAARQEIQSAQPVLFEHALQQLDAEHEDFKAYSKAVGKAANCKGRQLYKPLRAALTGEIHGPEMQAVWSLLDEHQCRERLLDAKQLCEGAS